MTRVFLFIIVTFELSISAISQPRLSISPDTIEFHSIFQRIQEVLFINEGNSPLSIDSLTYNNSNFYFIRFNKNGYYPHVIIPGDTLKMDCILSGFNYVTQTDTVDTMYIYNNGINPVSGIKIKIDFFQNDYRPGKISGTVQYNGTPVSQANLYFYYEGKYQVLKSATDILGNYNIQLPPGNYLVAAEKDSFYTTFGGGAANPFDAAYVRVGKDSTSTANVNMIHLPQTFWKVSGVVSDRVSGNSDATGLAVIRTGIHTPDSKVGTDTLNSTTIAAVIHSNGSYSISGITKTGYYFIEAFSDFNLPGYYKGTGQSPVLWQNADSVLVNSSLTNMNFQLSRDSATGGGTITGTILNGGLLPGKETVIYARSLDYNQEFTHTISKNDNTFELKDLPYGTYQLIAQQIDRNDSYSDTLKITPGMIYISGINMSFTTSITGEQDFSPSGYALNQNYPNPFNPSTKISFSIPHREQINLIVYNALGQQVAVLANGVYEAGSYILNFQPESKLSSGVYFYRLEAGNFISVRKMLLLK